MKTPTTLPRLFFRTLLAILFPLLGPLSFEGDRSLAAGVDSGPGLLASDPDCLPKDPPPPVVKIKVRVPACADPGKAIKYHICVENCATAEAHHVVVKDLLPANVKFVRADPEPSKQGAELQWQLGTIGGGASREIILYLLPTNKEDVKNCVRVQFEHGECVVTRQAGSSGSPIAPDGTSGATGDGAKPPMITTIPDVKKPALELVIRGPKEQYANLPSRYEITVTNKGKTKAANVQVSARVPDKLSVLKATEGGAAVENIVAWNLGHLEPGASRVLELTLKAKEAGDYCIKVAAMADQGVKSESEFCTKFVGVSAMTIEMSDAEDPVFIGHKTSYRIVIRNQGTIPVTNIRVRAFIPDSLSLERTNAEFEKRETVKGGEWIEFKTLPLIAVGEQTRYEVFVEAKQAGVTRFHVEMSGDQLEIGRPIIEQELTTIVDDRNLLP